MSKYRWINESVELSGPMTKTLLNTIKEAEELDLAGSIEYFAVADALDVIGKSLVTEGIWSETDWSNLCRRFPYE